VFQAEIWNFITKILVFQAEIWNLHDNLTHLRQATRQSTVLSGNLFFDPKENSPLFGRLLLFLVC